MLLISYIISYISYILVTFLAQLKEKKSYILSYIHIPIGICNSCNFLISPFLTKSNCLCNYEL